MKKSSTTKDGNDYVMLGEKRRDLRKYLLVMKVSSERDNILFGYAKNLGRSGMFISSVNPRKPGEECEISFKMPDDGERVSCRSRVIWKREFDPKERGLEPGMGVEFIDLPAEIRDRIDGWAKKGR
ncbi:MAG: PilZ domain-containing protein [Deltaproteobacteria bacterium]|nr:PilZ domain-containing protein [Deltaproteobacteria bacterium]